MDAPARNRAPPPPPAHNFDDPPDEFVGICELYEGDDATSAVEAPLDALMVIHLCRLCWFSTGGGGGAYVISPHDE